MKYVGKNKAYKILYRDIQSKAYYGDYLFPTTISIYAYIPAV